MMDYMMVLNRKFPNVQVSCIGPSTVYENLIWEGGESLPSKQALEDLHLVCLQDDKWEEIKAERERRKNAGTKVGDKWFHSDPDSRIQQLGLVLLGPNIPSGLLWKTMDKTRVPMTQTLAMQIFNAVAVSDSIIFECAEQHDANMRASADPTTYDFSSGWTHTFEEAMAAQQPTATDA